MFSECFICKLNVLKNIENVSLEKSTEKDYKVQFVYEKSSVFHKTLPRQHQLNFCHAVIFTFPFLSCNKAQTIYFYSLVSLNINCLKIHTKKERRIKKTEIYSQ